MNELLGDQLMLALALFFSCIPAVILILSVEFRDQFKRMCNKGNKWER